jgi:hypothetical protein
MLRPSDIPALPWWGWLFLSIGAWGTCVICQSFEGKDRGCFTIAVSFVAGFVAIFAGAMGVVLWFANS